MPATAATATLVVGRYTLYTKIASGGMATVYFGRMEGGAGFTRTVAIKRLHPHLAEQQAFVSMMIDEARLAARIRHPNVAQTLDVVATHDDLLIVMEYVAGESLARLLDAEMTRERRVPLPIVSAVMNGVLQGLHAAHEAKNDHGVPLDIVHRDISPQNIIVGIDGLARVIDFGVAKAAGRMQTTRDGVVKGKVPYMAPEQLLGKPATRLADVYAAGVVLWEALTGTRFIQPDEDAGMVAQVLHGRRQRPGALVEDIPPLLDEVVMRAIDRDPALRFTTARELAEALSRAVPPALSFDVGSWVEDVAKQVLDKRTAQLADIESSSSVTLRPPTDGRAAPHHAAADVRASDSGAPPTEPLPATNDAVVPGMAQRSPRLSIPAMLTPAQQLVADLRASWRSIVGVCVLALVVIVAWSAWPASSEHPASGAPAAPSAASAGTPSALATAAEPAAGPSAQPTAEPPAQATAEVPLVPRPPASAMASSSPQPSAGEAEPPPPTSTAPTSRPAAARPSVAKPPPRPSSPPATHPTKPTKPGGSVVYSTPD